MADLIAQPIPQNISDADIDAAIKRASVAPVKPVIPQQQQPDLSNKTFDEAIDATLVNKGFKTVTSPADTVRMINPVDQKLVDMPQHQWQQAAKEDKFILAPIIAKPEVDPTNPDNVLAINPVDNKQVSMPKDKWAEASFVDNFQTPTEYNKIQSEISKLEITSLNKDFNENTLKEHEKDDVLDSNHDFKMMMGDKEIPVPYELVTQAYKSGLRFKDENFNLLVSTYMKRYSDSALQVTNNLASSALFGIPDAIDKWRTTDEPFNKAIWGQSSNPSKAIVLANKILGDTTYVKEKILGSIGGTVINAIATAGIGGPAGEILSGEKLAVGVRDLIAGGEDVGLLRQAAGFGTGELFRGGQIVAPQVLTQYAIDKDPKAAWESLALGGGLTLGLGFGGKGITKVVGEISTLGKVSALDSAIRDIHSIGGGTEKTLEQLQASLGSLEQKETFMQNALKAGLSATPSTKELENVLVKLKTGAGLEPTLEKLETLLPDKIQATSLTGLISKEIQPLLERQLELFAGSKAEAVMQGIDKEIMSLADKSGNLSLKDLHKFAGKLSEEINWKAASNDVANIIKQKTFDSVMTSIMESGDIAASKADVKLASEWANGRGSMDIAKTLFEQFDPNTPMGKSIHSMLAGAAKVAKHAIEIPVHAAVGALGHAVAGPLGMGGAWGLSGLVSKGIKAVAKKVVGEPLKEAVENVAEKFTANSDHISSRAGWLKSHAFSPSIASYMAMDAVHSLNEQLEKIPSFLKGLPGKTAVNFSQNIDPIKQILGSEANGLTKEQQFKRLSEQISKLSANEDLRKQHVAKMVEPFAKDHPELAAGLADHMENKLLYTNSITPKNPRPDQPFTTEKDKWKPSASDRHDFNQTLKVINNPYALLDGVKDGTVTNKQVQAVKATSPQIYNLIQQEIAKQAYQGKIGLDYQHKVLLSMVMGKALDPSLTVIPQAQAVYGKTPSAGGPMQTTKGPYQSRGGSKINSDKLPASTATAAQRISNK